jgi:hypothetical protein
MYVGQPHGIQTTVFVIVFQIRVDEGCTQFPRLGPVWGTFGIQLAACILLIPGHYADYAIIECGKSDYYKCVNQHFQDKYEGNNLTTNKAASEVVKCMRCLKKTGMAVSDTWIDQNLCYYNRRYFWDDGRDGRKKDVFFFRPDGKLFLPIRSKRVKGGFTVI